MPLRLFVLRVLGVVSPIPLPTSKTLLAPSRPWARANGLRLRVVCFAAALAEPGMETSVSSTSFSDASPSSCSLCSACLLSTGGATGSWALFGFTGWVLSDAAAIAGRELWRGGGSSMSSSSSVMSCFASSNLVMRSESGPSLKWLASLSAPAIVLGNCSCTARSRARAFRSLLHAAVNNLNVVESSRCTNLSSWACVSSSSTIPCSLARTRNSSSCSMVMMRWLSSSGSAGSLVAIGILRGSADSTGRGSVFGNMSSPLQMTHMSCVDVMPTIQWCSDWDFLSEAQCSNGVHSHPAERTH
mmetsp:Transcript_14594/g.24291  ORF Transcript_14594/g.24291 Transcript_14594/m.24291 type:complete len:301 (+) Transcript_14594:572-1474(+)